MRNIQNSGPERVPILLGWQFRYFLLVLLSVGLIGFSPSSNSLRGGTGEAIAAGDPVIAAAGDIACDPSNSSFNGGNGTSNSCRQKYTSDLLLNTNLAAVLALGDVQYYCGGYEAFLQSYDLSWGRLKNITRPAVGNHEYLTSGGTGCTNANAGAAGYFNYFGAAAGDPGKGYYSFNIGAWHLIALNSNCGDAGGCGSSSPQGQWLAADLVANTNLCTLAFWHIPLFSSGGRAASNTQAFWQILYNANADLILAGHDHIYERFAPQTPSGTLDNVRGIRQFIVGSGGANHTSLAQIAANSEVRNVDTYGVLKLTLHPTSYDWQFVPEAGKTFTDSGTTFCHGQTSDVTPPSTPGNLLATAAAPNRVDLTWTASSDNVGVVGYQVYRNNVQIATSTSASYLDTGVQAQTAYTYKVIAYDGGGNFSTASNNASVTTPADTSPPSAPTNLVASATSLAQINLIWTASTDNVGVTEYRLFRNGTQIATSSVASYVDTTVQPQTTYTYYVIAVDGAGLTSSASNTATLTTSAAPTVLTILPAADTYVQMDLPTSNFGSNPDLGVDASPVKNLLLKFTVTGVSNRTVVNAKLRLYCIDAATFGGEFRRVADTTWTEAGVTWNTAPAADANILGTLGSVVAGTWYEIDVTSLVTRDGTFSLKVTSNSTNGADYSSKEGTAGVAPQLVITTASTATATNTQSPTFTPTASPSRTPTGNSTPVQSLTPSQTPVPSFTSTNTPASTPTSSQTPVFTATNTPTNTVPPTASFTPTFTLIPVIDPIFSDGFESSDVSAWSASAMDEGDLSTSSAAALSGNFGLQAVIDDNNPIYVVDNSPDAEPRYRARFYFDPNSIVMADRDSFFLLYGLGSDAAPVLRVEFRTFKRNYQLRAALRNDGNGWTSSNWTNVGDIPHVVELDWNAATTIGASNGSLTLWIDSVQIANLTNIANGTRRIDSIQFGVVADIDVGTRGTVFFDAFDSRRQSYIGP